MSAASANKISAMEEAHANTIENLNGAWTQTIRKICHNLAAELDAETAAKVLAMDPIANETQFTNIELESWRPSGQSTPIDHTECDTTVVEACVHVDPSSEREEIDQNNEPAGEITVTEDSATTPQQGNVLFFRGKPLAPLGVNLRSKDN